MSSTLFKRGFTLIELLVVIAIIGILASVVLAGLGSQRDKAREASALSTIRSTVPVAQVCRDAGANVIESTAAAGGTAICSNAAAVSNENWPALPTGWVHEDSAAANLNVGTDGFSYRICLSADRTCSAGERTVTCTQNNCSVSTL